MKTGRLGMGLVGPGFIAQHHLDAVRRLGDVEIVGIAGSSAESAARKAVALKAGRGFASYEELVNDPGVDVVHNTTPSYLHVPVTLAALEAGKHVISDKPLAMTPDECALLRDAAKAAGVVNAVTFNYRGNPLVQQARAMVAAGAMGPVVYVHGQYLQDWLTDDKAYSWRIDPEKGGLSSALADIGSHWCDLAEHVAGARIVSVLADLETVVKTRYTALGGSAEAFGKSAAGAELKAVGITAEDVASVLLRFDNGAKGSLKVGQVLPGHKNDLQLEVNGRAGSLAWKQERQNELWIGRLSKPNEMMAKDASLMLPAAAGYAHLPGGHQESWADAFANVIADVYGFIRDGGGEARRPATLCTFADAWRTSCIVDAMVRSHAAGGVWTSVVA